MRTSRLSLLFLPLVVLLAGCGSEGIQIAKSDPENLKGAQIFEERCAGCHSLDAAGAQGSASNANTREYKDGPNFNARKEKYVDQVLYAIRNGGFSSGPMPQNIVVGPEAEAVAEFVVKYSGSEGRDRSK